MIIAIDGPAASGKGTVARRLAEHLNFAYLDTGSLYRAVALSVIRAGEDPGDAAVAARHARALDPNLTEDPAIRTAESGAAASKVAAVPKVRAALLAFQRDFAARPPNGPNGPVSGAVLDGRDIGTVVCPDADVKLFVDADLAVRAARRLAELQQKDPTLKLDDVRAEMAARDERDRNRADSPLRPAADAHLLDTTDLDIDGAFLAAMKVIGGLEE